ncbi:MAG: glycosyltransferase family 2 protein, partial [Planctomycetota bacterium]
MKTAVIIPAFNEEESIGLVLGDIPSESVDIVIVVDNASTDETAERAKAAGATVVREDERGYGAACLRGIASLADDIELVVFLDGDYSDHPEELP